MIFKLLQFQLLVALPFCMVAQQPLRQQLKLKQQNEGLTLSTFYYGSVERIDFGSRSFELSKVEVNTSGKLGEGGISGDGELIAFDLSFSNPYHHYLAIVHSDGSRLRNYSNVVSPSSFCWSHSKSKLALNAAYKRQIHGELFTVDVASKATQGIEAGGYVTSQCWSPDDSQIVYEVGASIRIFDISESKSRELVKGDFPTWSPDGNWIAFYQDGGYYAVRPSGADGRELFKRKDVRSGLWWSPDGKVIAYMALGGKYDPHRDFDFPPRQLRVRRMADNTEDWILTEPDVGYVLSYQWILPTQAKKSK